MDKDKFMFEQIGARLKLGKRVILIVPDQFTLQAEKNAFNYLNVKGIMDLEVLSFSRLANRVFSEVGGGLETFINNYGKYMMISRILLSENPNFKVFKNLEGSADFIEKINNFISEIKNHEITPELLNKIMENEEGDSLLSRKLEDISKVYTDYEERMGSEQIDTADYLGLFISKISQSKLIQTSEFWLSGFDYQSPRNINAILEIAKTSGRMDVVLTAETGNPFFKATNMLASDIRTQALNQGIDSKIININKEYERSSTGREPLAQLEEQYCSKTPKAYDVSADQNIELITAANFYAEAETAAAGISQLVRDKKMRYGDILVICNDMDSRASVIKRVFSEYGLPIFVDQRRGVHHNPVLEYITALLDLTAENWRSDLIFKFLKTGLTMISPDETEELENYALSFKITGTKWKREFKYIMEGYDEEDLGNLNQIREKVVDFITSFEAGFKKAKNTKDRVATLFNFLSEDAGLPSKIEEYRINLEENQELEYAEEMGQVWDIILGIFDQLVGILGEEELTDDEFATILKTGFESIQMGMLPPSVDQILLGTMQRTRTGNIKALFVLGANDGVLPTYTGDEMLLNEDERDVLYDRGNVICRNDSQIMNEEQMAIYRNLSKPSDYLFVSYSVSDTEGNELNPSIIFEKIKRLFPKIQVKKDILNRDTDEWMLIQGRGSTINHLTDAMRKWITDDFIPEIWKGVYRWFDENKPQVTNRVVDGLAFRNNRDKIDEKFVVDLYKRTSTEAEDKILSSPSGLESYSRCPFSFFLSRGIRLKERRVFELDSRDIGDIYHETLMRFGEKMSADGLRPMDDESSWNKMSEEQCTQLISHIYDDMEKEYKDGLFKESRYEEYRGTRFKKIVTDVALELKRQINQGRIEKMFFETEFRRGGDFEPIVIEKFGKTVEVVGKMDRLDVLEGGYAKIIDYKSGFEELNRDDIISGWQMQLMIYMKAVTQSDKSLKPAGVFYFRIPDPHIKADGLTTEEIEIQVKKEMAKQYRMDGMVINDKSVIQSITGELSSKSYNIISAKGGGDDPEGVTGKAVVPKDDFAAIENTVSSLIEELCTDMLAGDVKAKPKESKSKEISACTYCQYRGICGYDKSFDM